MKRIIFADNLFLGKRARRREKKIRQKLRENRGMVKTFLIILPEYGTDLLEIVHSSVLMQGYFAFFPPRVVGIAWGREESMLLLKQIVSRVLRETGGYGYKAYFSFQGGARDEGERLC